MGNDRDILCETCGVGFNLGETHRCAGFPNPKPDPTPTDSGIVTDEGLRQPNDLEFAEWMHWRAQREKDIGTSADFDEAGDRILALTNTLADERKRVGEAGERLIEAAERIANTGSKVQSTWDQVTKDFRASLSQRPADGADR